MKHLSRFLRTFLTSLGALALVASGGTLAGAAVTQQDDAAGTIDAKAIDDHDCDETEWHFIITQVDEETAPDAIDVTYADAGLVSVGLTKVTPGGVAHYTLDAHLTDSVESASAPLPYEGWHEANGQFNLSHGPCGEEAPDEGDVDTEVDFTSVTVECPAPAADGAALIEFRVEGNVEDGQATVVLLEGETEHDSVLVNVNDGVAGGQFDRPADAGALTLSIDYDEASATESVPAKDCSEAPEVPEETEVPEENVVVEGDEEVLNDSRQLEEVEEEAEVTTDVVADEEVDVRGDQEVAEAPDTQPTATEQPETVVLGSQEQRASSDRCPPSCSPWWAP